VSSDNPGEDDGLVRELQEREAKAQEVGLFWHLVGLFWHLGLLDDGLVQEREAKAQEVLRFFIPYFTAFLLFYILFETYFYLVCEKCKNVKQKLNSFLNYFLFYFYYSHRLWLHQNEARPIFF